VVQALHQVETLRPRGAVALRRHPVIEMWNFSGLFTVSHSAFRAIIASAALVATCGTAEAQNYASTGQSWSSGWGFASASDRSLGLQKAQVIKNAEQGTPLTSVTNNTYNTTNDSRTNYVETNNAAGDVTANSVGNDQIGTNTNAVGSMNTGNTTISLTGDDNVITATNSADNSGCTDGSVWSATVAPLPGLSGVTVGTGSAVAGSVSGGESGYGVTIDSSGLGTNVCN
jgi:hypothetical protein